ncbi:MAG: hypothetical protein R3C05_18075 [Pirellulaceae bacterium]
MMIFHCGVTSAQQTLPPYNTATPATSLGLPVAKPQPSDMPRVIRNDALASSGASHLGSTSITHKQHQPPTRLPHPDYRLATGVPASDHIPFAPQANLNLPLASRLASTGSAKKESDAMAYPPPMSAYATDFAPTPLPAEALIYDPVESRRPYDGKYPVPVQRPLIEWGRPFYLNGKMPRSQTFLGETNLVQQHFYVYGDHRVGFGSGTNAAGDFSNLAQQLRLDLDWGITSTERFHAFIAPFDRNGDFTGINFVDGDVDLQTQYNIDFLTGFFEGDLGAITGGMTDTWYPFDLPFTAGLIPLLFQNGIWMEDAVTGAAFSLPAKNSPTLRWANFDATFFAAVDQINSDAFPGDKHAAQLFGTAWFVEAYDGYFETGYAYVNDRLRGDRSYHNMTFSFARRYFWKVSNAIRVIVNTGQDLPREQRTADGALLLLENAFVAYDPLRFVPYLNLFAGFRNPQSVARAGIAGGILRNTGINFESDLLNGYPTLDATANNTFGGAIGLNLLGPELNHQLVVEAAFVGVMESQDDRRARGNQAALGMRYQLPLSYRTLIRMDTMYGWREHDDDLVGGRIEYRWKF